MNKLYIVYLVLFLPLCNKSKKNDVERRNYIKMVNHITKQNFNLQIFMRMVGHPFPLFSGVSTLKSKQKLKAMQCCDTYQMKQRRLIV